MLEHVTQNSNQMLLWIQILKSLEVHFNFYMVRDIIELNLKNVYQFYTRHISCNTNIKPKHVRPTP